MQRQWNHGFALLLARGLSSERWQAARSGWPWYPAGAAECANYNPGEHFPRIPRTAQPVSISPLGLTRRTERTSCAVYRDAEIR